MPITVLTYAPISLDELKTHLRTPGTNADEQLKLVINEVTGVLEHFLGDRQIVSRGAITEYFSPLRNACELHLGEWPAHTVTSVHESADTPRTYTATTLLVEGTDYEVDKVRGLIRRLSDGSGSSSYWLAGRRTVKVVFEAGYQKPAGTPAAAAALPWHLKRAALYVAEKIYKEPERGGAGVSSFSDAAGNVTRLMGDIPPSIAALIEGEKRIEFDSIRERVA